LDASATGLALLNRGPGDRDWHGPRQVLSSRFPDFRETPKTVRDATPLSITSKSEGYAGEGLLE